MTIERRNGYLRAEMPCVRGLEARLQRIDAIAAAATQDKCPRLLLDARGQNPVPTTMDRFGVAKHIACLSWSRALKIAIVEPKEQQDSGRFTETVARNRGALLRVFTDYDEAVDWLCSHRQ